MNNTNEMNRTRTVVGALLFALVASAVTVIGGANAADAATVRTGARWDHLDVLLSADETSSVARGLTGGVVMCWKVGSAAAALGLTRGPIGAVVGAVVGTGVCVSAVTVCAAQAYRQGRKAGMTFSPAWFGMRYWCWSY